MTFAFKLERLDGTPAEAPSFQTTVLSWSPGDTIPLGVNRTLQAVRVRDNHADQASVLVVRAGGLEHRSPDALRHSYATFAIAAGVSLFEFARFMGTSVEQIDKTYGHLLPDALDRTRQALDVFALSQERDAERAL